MHDFSRYHFQGQRPSEVILSVVHRHWFNILMHFFVLAGFTLLVFGSIFLLPLSFPGLETPATRILFLFIQNTLLLFLWLYGYLIWIDYYFDVWIVTNERIINIEQKGLFVRIVSELQFSRIQDVTTSVNGLIPTILNFGDVTIQTAAEEEQFLFRQVPDPYRVKDLLMKRVRDEHDEELTRMAKISQRFSSDQTSKK